MLRKLFSLFCLTCQICVSQSQDLLTINDAIKIALEKNYAVLISKNEVEIAKAQNNIGNAGMSPQVSLNGNYNLANVNSYQEFSNGTVQDKKAAQNTNTGASVNLSWVVFDGLKMFAIKKRLYQNEKLNEIQLRQEMENTVYATIIAYYDIVRIEKLISANKQNMSIYEERKKIAKLKLDIGSDSKVEYLLTQTDENKAKSEMLKLEQQLSAAKILLNNLLVRPVETEFNVENTINVVYDPVLEDLKKTTVKNNSSILISQQNSLIAEQSIKEARSLNLPQLQLNGAYNFILNQSQAGFVLLNKQLGLNAGLSASWMIFNGTKNNRLVKEKQIALLNNRFLTDASIQQTDALAYVNFKSYQINKQIQDLEKLNLASAEELVNISMERYKIGKGNLLETKETQKTLEDAQIRYINALYETKKAETELLRANGGLIK